MINRKKLRCISIAGVVLLVVAVLFIGNMKIGKQIADSRWEEQEVGVRRSEDEDIFKTRDARHNIITLDTRKFIDETDFLTSVAKAKVVPSFEHVKGGIAPHHNIACYMMADLFKSISAIEKPEVIYVIGPNHFGLNRTFQVCKFHFDTYEGIVECDEEAVAAIEKSPLIYYGEEALISNEHSVNILMNYVGKYFPGIKVVPIIVGDIENEREFQAIYEAILETTKGRECLFIGSIDFSHYLPVDVADKHDIQTKRLIQDKDMKMMMTLNDDYIDSPMTMKLTLALVEAEGETDVKIIDHNNMVYILNRDDIRETTSYFTVMYGE